MSLAPLFSNTVESVFVFLGLTFVIRLTLPRLARLAQPNFAVATGILFGVVAVGATQASFLLADGIRGDLHNVVLVGSAVFGGPWAAFVATAIAALYRATLGGTVPVALLGMAGAAGVGFAFHRWVAVPRRNAMRARDFLALGVALALINVVLPFGLTIGNPALFARGLDMAMAVLPVVLVVYPLAMLALCAFVRDELKRIDDAAALKRANDALVARTAALRDSEARLRAFIDNSPEHINLKDGHDRILLVNRQFAKLHGIDAEQVIGKTVHDVAPPDEAAAIMAEDREVRASGRAIRKETELTFVNGRRSVLVTKFPIASRDGSPALIGTIMTDVTEFKRLQEQLHHAQKMETVGQLAGGIAHDFNNLLTVVIGNIELLMDHLRATPPLLRFAETARAGAIRAAELTSRLLAFSRRQALQPVAFDLNDLVVGMAELLQRTLGEQVELRTELAAGLWPVLADLGQVESVVLNLVVNARDAMERGGQLTVATANVELDEDYARSREEVRAGTYVMLTVTDAGVGMPPEVVERAFEPFFTTKEVGKGTGLGLSMVYGFVKQSGGHVEVYSEVGLGTTVKVYLPRAGATVATFSESAVETRPPTARGHETILVVEDDPLVRDFVVGQFGALGYTVVEASSGADALAKLEAQHVHLMLTDVAMPGGMTGFELAEAALARRPGLRILFTSGYAEEALRQQGRLRPGTRLLSKPYPKADLAAAIRDLLDRSGDDPAASAGPDR